MAAICQALFLYTTPKNGWRCIKVNIIDSSDSSSSSSAGEQTKKEKRCEGKAAKNLQRDLKKQLLGRRKKGVGGYYLVNINKMWHCIGVACVGAILICTPSWAGDRLENISDEGAVFFLWMTHVILCDFFFLIASEVFLLSFKPGGKSGFWWHFLIHVTILKFRVWKEFQLVDTFCWG